MLGVKMELRCTRVRRAPRPASRNGAQRPVSLRRSLRTSLPSVSAGKNSSFSGGSPLSPFAASARGVLAMPPFAIPGRGCPRVLPKSLSHPNRFLPGLCVAAMLLLGCGTTGSYVWVSDYREPLMPNDKNTILVPGDVITVRVYQQPDMSTKTRVRNDGKVSMPLLNDVVAAGLTPEAFARALQVRLKEFMNAPVVTISLDDPRPNTIPVTGEVTKPGVFQLEPGAGVLTALASAGGLTPFANWSKVFVIRQSPAPVRIRFDYHELRDGDGTSLQFQLRQGDAVIAE